MTSPTAELSTLITEHDLPDTIDRAVLLDVFASLSGLPSDGGAAAVVEDAFLAAVGAAQVELELRPGGWTVNLSGTLANTAIATAAIAGILWAAGADELPVVVLPAVLPLVVNIKRARLSPADRTLLLELRTNAGAATGATVHPDVLYNRLPAHIQDQVSPLDFTDFMGKLVDYGVADDPGHGDVRLRPADRTAWIRIRFT